MTKHDSLEPALAGLAKLQVDLAKQGGPSENGQLFEQILEAQDRILKSFGLPISPDYENLFGSIQLQQRLN